MKATEARSGNPRRSRHFAKALTWTFGGLIAVFGALSPPGGLSAQENDAATAEGGWNRAVEIAAANSEWLPLRTELAMQQFNGRGDLVSEGTTIVQRRVDGDGQVEVLIRQEGDDPPPSNAVTEGALAPGEAGPLSPHRQHSVEWEATGRVDVRRGRRAEAYRFRLHQEERGRIVGTVWIDIETGAAVALESSPENPPDRLIESTSVVTFNPDPDAWYPTSATSQGKGRLLLVTREVVVRIALGEYVRR